MSQMNENTSKNLFEFATYFKRILQLSLVSIGIAILAALIGVIGTLTLSLGLLTVALIIGMGVLVISIIQLVFQVMMYIRISNAKNSSPHPELVKSCTFFMISLILAGISVIVAIVSAIIAFFNPLGSLFLDILTILLSVGILICDLMAWQALGKYIAVYGQEKGNSQGFQMVADGIKTYIITIYISLAVQALSFILGFVGWGLGLVAFIGFVVSIIMFVVQFKIANGMLMIFGSAGTTELVAPLASVQSTTPSSGVEHFCKNCGAKLMPGAKFCTACGTNLE